MGFPGGIPTVLSSIRRHSIGAEVIELHPTWIPNARVVGQFERLPRSSWNFGDDGPGVIVTQ